MCVWCYFFICHFKVKSSNSHCFQIQGVGLSVTEKGVVVEAAKQSCVNFRIKLHNTKHNKYLNKHFFVHLHKNYEFKKWQMMAETNLSSQKGILTKAKVPVLSERLKWANVAGAIFIYELTFNFTGCANNKKMSGLWLLFNLNQPLIKVCLFPPLSVLLEAVLLQNHQHTYFGLTRKIQAVYVKTQYQVVIS